MAVAVAVEHHDEHHDRSGMPIASASRQCSVPERQEVGLGSIRRHEISCQRPDSFDVLLSLQPITYCASHSRHFWGFRLHALLGMARHARGPHVTAPKIGEKSVYWSRCQRRPGPFMLILIGDENFRGRDFETVWRPSKPGSSGSPQRRPRARPASRADAPAHRADLPGPSSGP